MEIKRVQPRTWIMVFRCGIHAYSPFTNTTQVEHMIHDATSDDELYDVFKTILENLEAQRMHP